MRMSAFFIFAFVTLFLLVVGPDVIPLGIDWEATFKPVSLSFWRGENPYNDPVNAAGAGYFNPPWIAMALAPIALIPPPYDRVVFFIVTLYAFFLYTYRMKFHPVAMVLFLVSIPVISNLWDGNIDAFVLLGATLPPVYGLFLIMAKPQVGIVVALLWAYQCIDFKNWRETWQDSLEQLWRTFWPVTTAYLISFVLYGFWLGRSLDLPGVSFWNVSIWPWGLVFAFTLTVRAIKDRNIDFALAAGPFWSPYVGLQSLGGPLAPLRRSPILMALAVIGSWVFVLVRLMPGV